MAGEDLGGRLRRGIDRLIGVAAGKRERRDRENDGKPHGRFPTVGRPAAARARGRRGGELGHQVPVRFSQAIGQPIGGACWRRRHWRLWRSARVQASPRRKLSLGHVFPVAFTMLSRREHFKDNFHAAWASDSSNSPESLRESENTNNLFHQTEISLILLPVAEPETDRVRMLREQGRIYRSGDVNIGSEGSEIFYSKRP